MNLLKQFPSKINSTHLVLSTLTTILVLMLIFTFYRWFNPAIHSPLHSGNQQTFDTTSPEYVSSIKYGFLPFWNLNTIDQKDIKPYTHIAYFALDLNADGSIKTRTRPGESDPGWYHYQNTLDEIDFIFSNPNTQTHLVFKIPDDDVLKTIIASESSRKILADTIISTTTNGGFDGINIDFEPTASPNQNTRNNFTSFIELLNQSAKSQSSPLTLVIDVYANAARRQNLWDLEQLEPHTDYFVFMAYDYHRTNSPVAGPIAPLYPNSNGSRNYAIINDLAFLTQLVPPEKIIMGIPQYGYQWQVSLEGNQAHTYPKTGQTITNKELETLISQQDTFTHHWNSHTLTPWLEFTSNQKTYHLHYDNNRSIGFKNELITLTRLVGSAEWAIGY